MKDDFAGGRLFFANQKTNESRLTGARTANQGDKFSGANIKVDSFQDFIMSPIMFLYILEMNHVLLIVSSFFYLSNIFFYHDFCVFSDKLVGFLP